jgi:hypothetical protein
VSVSNKTLTLQPYPREQVWLKGSVVVTDWISEGAVWRKDGWTYRFNRLTLPSGYIDPSAPLAGYPDMAFIDGVPLRQVGARSQVTPGSFYVDEVGQKLYVGDNPTGRTVEATARTNVLTLYNAPNSKILGLGFAHAASKADSASSAVTSYRSNGVLIEHNTFAWNAASGFEVGELSDDVIVRGNAMVYNGLVGATSWGVPNRLRFERNHVAFNNQERFSIYWAAAGVKLNGVAGATVSDNVVERNTGPGIWCDNGCSAAKIVRNVSRANTYQGIMYEISDGGVIASNIVVDNASSGGGGVYVSESTNTKVYNNTIAASTVPDARSIDVNSGSRKTTSGVVIKNNIVSHSNASGLWAVRVQDNANGITADSMVSAMDFNAYYRKASSAPPAAVRWGRVGGYDNYATVSAFKTAKGKELNALAIDNPLINPLFINEAAGDYRLTVGSPAKGRGQPLPADVAAAIGVAANVAVDMGALRWPSGALITDTSPPLVPTGLLATGGTNRVNLSWTAPTDNVGVTAYRIYRNGVWIRTSVGAPTTYTDAALASATIYSYTVMAQDAAGNLSLASLAIAARTA